MIEVTRFNGSLYYINPDMILFVEATPDTVVTLTNGEKLLIKETPQQVVDKFSEFKRHIYSQGIRVKAGE